MNASTQNLHVVLAGKTSLEIPFFQRGYVWDIDQWERFMLDITNAYDPTSQNSAGQDDFLGSLILKKSKNGVCTVIDGQQRLTTLFLFFKALCLLTGQDMWYDWVFKIPSSSQAKLNQSHSVKNDFDSIMAWNQP